MIYKWLQKNNKARDVIVFFTGWGFNESVVEHLRSNVETDILFVSDYTTLDTDLPDLHHYKNRTLIAWSFGVGSYVLWQQHRPNIFTRKVAINGTIQAVDRHRGIPEKVVQHTINTLTQDSFKEFIQRCYNNDGISASTNINIDTKKVELINIKERDYSSVNNSGASGWDAIWISQHDTIFPLKNQHRAWLSSTTKTIDAPHVAFTHWSHWQDILTVN